MTAPPARRAGFLVGVSCGLRGLGRCVTTPALWPWAIVPALLTACLFLLPFWGLHATFEEEIRAFADEHLGGPGGSIAAGVFAFVVAAVALVCAWLVFAPLARVVAAPFLALLSDRTVKGLIGREPPVVPGGPFVRFVLVPLRDALLFLGIRVVWTVLAFPFLFVPVAGPFLFFGLLLPLEGLDRMDVAQSSRAVPLGRRLALVVRNFGACTGLGLVAGGLVLVPFVNVLLLPGLAVGAVLLDREISTDFPEASA